MAGMVIKQRVQLTDDNGLDVMPILRGHATVAVAVLMAFQWANAARPLAGFLLICKGSAWVLRPIFGRAE